MVIGQKAAQKIEVVLAPFDDLVEIVACSDRPANGQKQNFRERVRDPPRLPIILDKPEMVQKQPQLRPVGKLQHGGGLRITAPTESRLAQSQNRR
jgi:hypothetical protein